MPLGRIKNDLIERGYSFILADNGGPEVFFHRKVLIPPTLVKTGARVAYEVETNPDTGKLRAKSVRVIS